MIDVLEREIEIKELLLRRQRLRRHLNGMQGLFWNTYIHCTISESLAVDGGVPLLKIRIKPRTITAAYVAWVRSIANNTFISRTCTTRVQK